MLKNSIIKINIACVLNKQSNKCEMEFCSHLTSNYKIFTTLKKYRICDKNEDQTNCEIRDKDCNEYPTDDWDIYGDFGGDYRCILNIVTNQCKKYKWAELPITDLG